MEEALYLIKHRVRDKVAFDVAQRLALSGGRELWLIPTSGHRAYPFAYTPLSPLVEGMTECADWRTLPDHYRSATQREGSMARLRSRLREIWKVRAKRATSKAKHA